jgi:alcohol dehydrogenase class IV
VAQQVGAELRRMGCNNALIVTDGHLIKAGLVAQVQASLDAEDIGHVAFDGCVPEPSTAVIDSAAAFAKPHGVDVVIGLGGGSNMDVAKIVAAVLAHGGQAADYFGQDKIPGPILPLIAMPTTAGTGSEVSAVAIIEDPAKHLKLAMSSNLLRPKLALVDPLLTTSCPPKVTAESGIDALTHAIEAYTNIDYRAQAIPNEQFVAFAGKYPLTDALAEKAIKLIGANLRLAVYQPQNLDAREAMSLAATLGGMAFSNAGVGIVHALQYPIGAITHTSHGLGNGLMLPYVMDYLRPSNPAAFAEIGQWLGSTSGDAAHQNAAHQNAAHQNAAHQNAAHQNAVEAVHRLKADIGIPARLSDIGIKAKQLRGIAETAASNGRLMPLCPRTVNADVLEMILRSAL